MFAVAPVLSVTLAVKLAVPEPVGIPDTVTVPAAVFVVGAENPVPPAAKPVTVTEAYGVPPPVTVTV